MVLEQVREIGPLPWSITEVDTTNAGSTTNVESCIATYTVPAGTKVGLAAGKDFLYLYLATAVPAAITTGKIRMAQTDPSGSAISEDIVPPTPVSVFSELADKNKKFFLPKGALLMPFDKVKVFYTGADVSAAAQFKMYLTGQKVLIRG